MSLPETRHNEPITRVARVFHQEPQPSVVSQQVIKQTDWSSRSRMPNGDRGAADDPAASRDADDDLPECAPFTDTSQGGGYIVKRKDTVDVDLHPPGHA